MLAHSQGTFCRVVHFRISTTAPAIGLSMVPKKNGKNYGTYHTVPCACILLHEPEKKNHDSYVLVPARTTAVKLLLGYSTGKIKFIPLGPHFEF